MCTGAHSRRAACIPAHVRAHTHTHTHTYIHTHTPAHATALEQLIGRHGIIPVQWMQHRYILILAVNHFHLEGIAVLTYIIKEKKGGGIGHEIIQRATLLREDKCVWFSVVCPCCYTEK